MTGVGVKGNQEEGKRSFPSVFFYNLHGLQKKMPEIDKKVQSVFDWVSYFTTLPYERSLNGKKKTNYYEFFLISLDTKNL